MSLQENGKEGLVTMQYEGEESEGEQEKPQVGVEFEGEDIESDDEPPAKEVPADEAAALGDSAVDSGIPEELNDLESTAQTDRLSRSAYSQPWQATSLDVTSWTPYVKAAERERGRYDDSVEICPDTHSDGTPLPRHLKRLRLLNINCYEASRAVNQNLVEFRMRSLDHLRQRVVPTRNLASSALVNLQRSSRNLSSVSLSLQRALTTMPHFANIHALDHAS
ncbi:hypothetical protein DIPPA_01701 [Diplonema papillatum]|nr:hypothetical protein DIPPA_01701 [Diplonema papillatum]